MFLMLNLMLRIYTSINVVTIYKYQCSDYIQIYTNKNIFENQIVNSKQLNIQTTASTLLNRISNKNYLFRNLYFNLYLFHSFYIFSLNF